MMEKTAKGVLEFKISGLIVEKVNIINDSLFFLVYNEGQWWVVVKDLSGDTSRTSRTILLSEEIDVTVDFYCMPSQNLFILFCQGFLFGYSLDGIKLFSYKERRDNLTKFRPMHSQTPIFVHNAKAKSTLFSWGLDVSQRSSRVKTE